MRRLLLSALGLMPLALFLGCCNHLAGKCDCDRSPTIACPCYSHTIVTAPPPAVKVVEPIKPLPEPNKEE